MRFIKSLNDFLIKESSNSNFTKGQIAFYKNQYMDKPEEVVIIDIREFSNDTIDRLTIKFENGRTMELLPYQFKYLSSTKQEKDDYDIVKEIGDQIYDKTGESPNQISSLFSFIKQQKISDTIYISFTEEIKDGRSQRFNINRPLLLKNTILGSEDFQIKIDEITFDKQEQQPSDYNEYITYYYNVKVTKI
jgi:hypothetical protein